MSNPKVHLPEWEQRQRVEENGYLFDIYVCTRCQWVIATNAGQRPSNRGERHGPADTNTSGGAS